MAVDTAQTGVTGVLPPDQGPTQTVPDNIPDPNSAPSQNVMNTGVSVPPTGSDVPSGVLPGSIQPTQPQATTQIQPSPQQPAPTGATNTPKPVPDPNGPNQPAPPIAHRVNAILNAVLPPRVHTSINVNTGETEKTPVPRSRGDILMALALEAISGGLSGLQGKGPGRYGQAAQAGLEQGQRIQAQRNQQDQQQAQEASADYARHAAILETNMRMWQNARTVGRQDYDQNMAYVAPHRAFADTLPPGIIKDVINEDQLNKLHIAKDSVIPYGVAMRPDPSQPDGQAKGSHGEPLWDIQYAVVDPKFKVPASLPQNIRDVLTETGTPGLVNGKGDPIEWPSNMEMALHQYMNLMAKGNGLLFAKNKFKEMADTLNDYGQGRTGGYQFNNVKPVSLPTHEYDDDIHKAALKYGMDENLIKAMIKQESGGNPSIVNKKSGATGLMQLMEDTAKDLGVTDRTDPHQSIDGGVKYLRQMFDKYQGNARLALAAYNAGPSKVNDRVPPIPETQDYVKSILGATGISDQVGLPQGKPADIIKPVDLAAATAQDPNFPQAATAMMKYLGDKDNLGADFDNFRKMDPDNYGRIVNAMSATGMDIHSLADAVAQQTQVRKDADAVRKAGEIKQNSMDITRASQQAVENILKGPDTFQLPDNVNDMSTQELGAYLKAHGAGVDKNGDLPDRFEAMVQMGRNERSIEAAPQRVWATGSPNELDREQVLTYINKFINPFATDNSYKNWQEVHDVNKGVGQTIYNAGVAVNHAALLRQALDEMHNGHSQALNRIGNAWDLKLEGLAPQAQFQAIANAYAREVSKVAAGQASPYAAEVDQAHEALDRDLSQDALTGVIDSSNKLMHGRIHAIDENTYKQTGRHLDVVDDAATAEFQRLGQETPWTWGSLPKPPQEGAVLNDPNVIAQYFQAAGGGPPNQKGITPQQKAKAFATATKLALKNGWTWPGAAPVKPSPATQPPQAGLRSKPQPQHRSPIAPPNQNTGIINDNDEASVGDLAFQDQD